MHAASLLLLSLIAQADLQPGQDAKASAQALLKDGAQAYQQGRFFEALNTFNKAYEIFPSPKLLFNIAQANRELGRPVEAINAFEGFLSKAPDASPELLAEAKRSISDLSQTVGKLLIDATVSGAEIKVDGKRVGRTPLVDMILVLPGDHQVTATHASAVPSIKEVNVEAGTVQAVMMQLEPRFDGSVAAPAAASPGVGPTAELEMRERASTVPVASGGGWLLGRKWTWIAAGSTVLFAASATIAGLSMESRFDELRRTCGKGSGADWTGCSASDLSSLDARKNTANIFWGLAATAAVATGALFYWEGRAVSATPMVGKTTGLVAQVRY